MNASRVRWIVLALIYTTFHLWYGGSSDPVTQEEIEKYVTLGADVLGPDSEGLIRRFLSTDDGKEFVNVNLNKYRESPQYRDGRDVGDITSREIEGRYAAGVVPELVKRAGHPLMMVQPILSMGGAVVRQKV